PEDLAMESGRRPDRNRRRGRTGDRPGNDRGGGRPIASPRARPVPHLLLLAPSPDRVASRGDAFSEQLDALGTDANHAQPPIAFVAAVADATRAEVGRWHESGPVADMAALALRRALSETAGQQTPSLFGSTV